MSGDFVRPRFDDEQGKGGFEKSFIPDWSALANAGLRICIVGWVLLSVYNGGDHVRLRTLPKAAKCAGARFIVMTGK
jgi:hypothetical protein